MATEYQIRSLQECAAQTAQGLNLSDKCEEALAAMPSSPPQPPRHLYGEFDLVDIVGLSLIALIPLFFVVSFVLGLIEQLLVRLKLRQPRQMPAFFHRQELIKPPPAAPAKPSDDLDVNAVFAKLKPPLSGSGKGE